MRRIGNIHCLEKTAQDNNNQNSAPWVIMFHGFGADAGDLFSLADVIPTKKEFNWLFPNGLLELPISLGAFGRAWWPINMTEHIKAMETGVPKDYSQLTPPGLEEAFSQCKRMIEKMGVPWNQIILGGFSQGAMLATELYLRAEESPLGLMILSGTPLHIDNWRSLAQNRAGKKFFQSHGKQDPTLAFSLAQKLETTLTQSGMKGRLHSFNGGHEIPPQIIMAAGEYLSGL